MGSEVYIILKRHKGGHKEHPSSEASSRNVHQEYRDNNRYYREYVDKYGYHFNDKLAEWAISKMENLSGPHSWSLKQVDSVVNSIHPSRSFKHHVTLGDLAYQANMYYADLYPDGINVEQNCVKSAVLIANDPDGYEGQIFCRWLTDTMMKSVEVDWEHFL